ncbi:MAG: hypothetical protein CMF31_08555 [Kordiimonas sp.]|nr:hypothetical protein [Kordiimonas sp.]|tara:strand:+ start:2837 stop:3181 length:345 start_codon:yes stop_codon:yes gene_type:complete
MIDHSASHSARLLQLEKALDFFCPLAPSKDQRAILEHALHTKPLNKARPENAIWLSLTSYVRHNFTCYDEMLSDGYSKDEARFFCANDMENVLEAWGCPRKLSETEHHVNKRSQ